MIQIVSCCITLATECQPYSTIIVLRPDLKNPPHRRLSILSDGSDTEKHGALHEFRGMTFFGSHIWAKIKESDS